MAAPRRIRATQAYRFQVLHVALLGQAPRLKAPKRSAKSISKPTALYGDLPGEGRSLKSILDYTKGGISTPGSIARILNLNNRLTRSGDRWTKKEVERVLRERGVTPAFDTSVE